MPRNYIRKTNHGNTTKEVMEIALLEVQMGISLRQAAKNHGIDRITLTRYKNRGNKEVGYSGTKKAHMVFSDEMEKELADHVCSLANSFYGLSKDKTLELAYEYAVKNEVNIPPSWIQNKRAGKHPLEYKCYIML